MRQDAAGLLGKADRCVDEEVGRSAVEIQIEETDPPAPAREEQGRGGRTGALADSALAAGEEQNPFDSGEALLDYGGPGIYQTAPSPAGRSSSTSSIDWITTPLPVSTVKSGLRQAGQRI